VVGAKITDKPSVGCIEAVMKGGHTMPGFNQAGPSGRGPMTGWGRGRCNTNRPGNEAGIRSNIGAGRGMRMGRGFRRGLYFDMDADPRLGFGRNRAAFMQASADDSAVEIDGLKRQAEMMQSSLDTITNRITEMEKSK